MIFVSPLWYDSEEKFGYKSSYGHTVRREWGQTPDGRHIHGRWVFRSPKQRIIDLDVDRENLLERHDLKILYQN